MIREAGIEDLDALVDVYQKDGRKHSKPLGAYPVADWILRKTAVVVLHENKKGKPDAFIVVRPKGETASIDMLSVKRSCKEANEVKKRLVEEAGKKSGARVLTVYVSKRDKLVDFFKKNGFKLVEEIKESKQLFFAKTLRLSRRKKPTRILHKKGVFKKQLKENLRKLEETSGDEFGPDLIDLLEEQGKL